MSWVALLALCGACYAMKAVGPLLLANRSLPPQATRLIGLVAVPVLAALVVVQTIGDGRALSIDARLPALGVAAVLVWRKAPFLVIILAAAVTAGLVRALL